MRLKSGFLSIANKCDLSYIGGKDDSIIGNVLDSISARTVNSSEGYYSKDVERLYELVITSKASFTSLDFIDELIKISDKMFMNNDIIDWFKLQLNSDVKSSLHYEFIKESKELLLGSSDTIDLSKYLGILNSSSSVSTKQDIEISYNSYCLADMMTNVFSKNKSTSGNNPLYGLEQYMLFLKIVFGK